MKAITISQPYATLIADGRKWVENRNWQTHYRGELAIHAGKGTQYATKARLELGGYPLGKVIATCQLVACVHMETLKDSIGNDSLQDSLIAELGGYRTIEEVLTHQFAEGDWCWILHDIKKLAEPIAATGKQGFWEWTQ